VVVVLNELAQHPELTPGDFDCFKKIADEGEYVIFDVQ
jgi:hypothetical protein